MLKLLDSENVEPVIRRSALTQIGVMVEDHLLHRTFLENDGLRILLHVMRSALTEKNYEDYPDSIIPAVGILKYLCLYNASVRHELSCNLDVYCFVLRGIIFLVFYVDSFKLCLFQRHNYVKCIEVVAIVNNVAKLLITTNFDTTCDVTTVFVL